MTSHPDKSLDRLAALGLPGAVMGELEQIIIASHPAGDGRGVQALTSPPLAAETGTFVPVDSTLLKSGGLFLAMLDDSPDLLRLMCAEDNVIVDIRGFDWVGFDDDDAGVACCLASAPEPGVVMTTRGSYLIDWPARRIRSVTWPLATTVAEKVTSPIREWVSECEDTWLRQQILTRLATGGMWAEIVSTGMFARLEQWSKTRVREIVAKQLSGHADPQVARPWRWVRSLPHDQLDAVEGLALAEIDLLQRTMDESLRMVEPGDSDWLEDLREICHRRDDVECVWRLLSEVKAAHRVKSLLTNVDATGDAFVAGISGLVILDDERLTRVAQGQPSAWWARMAVRPAQ
jgi:hypothetical protein